MPAALTIAIFAGLVFGLIGGLLGRPLFAFLRLRPSQRIWNAFRLGISVLLVFGLTSMTIGGLSVNPPLGLVGGVVGGLVGGVVGGLVGGLSFTSLHTDIRLRPNQGIHASGKNAFRLGISVLLVFGLAFGAAGWLSGRQSIGLAFGVVGGLVGGPIGGLVGGLVVGLIGGLIGGLLFGGNAYLQHYLLRFFLARNGALLLQAIPLLEEATDCILLQRVSGGYRFIHPLLQEHFASLDVEAMLEQDARQTKV